MSKNKFFITISKFFKNNLELIQSIGIIITASISIVGIFISLNQLESVNQQAKINSVKDSADTILYLDNELNTEPTRGVGLAIEYNTPILLYNKGDYSESDLERYLDIMETLNDFYYSNLISQRMVCVNFSEQIIQTYEDKEVQTYISKSRTALGDDTFYQGLSDLYSEFDQFKNKDCPQN